MSAEEVIINIIAENKASTILAKVKSDLEALQKIGGVIGENIKLPQVTGGNFASSVAYDFNKVREQISSAQKALDGFGTSSKKGLLTDGVIPPKDINEASNLLNKLRSNAQKGIKINIDNGNIKRLRADTYKINAIINEVRKNIGNVVEGSKSSFLASNGTKSLIPIGSPYDPRLPSSSNGNWSGSQDAIGKGEVAIRKSGELLDLSKEKALNFGKASQDAGKMSYSSFHQLNNMLIVVGGAIQDMGTKIAGIFGAAGLGGMIEKMWQGAAQRQQNMMYLTHQKGVAQANKYYDEIMDIVTRLPGDDTFLTNILNMASALDKSLKIDNLKEAGTAITDYYMAATMKGENSYETQKDIRKYITNGDTRGMRNSVLASEIDLLKNKNSVLERTQALEKALEKTGFSGMSEYESALNQFEEFKGHFQKAFADLGGAVLAVTQPLMKFYNTLDSIFGSRISQMIIVFATVLVGLLTTVGGGLIILSSTFRMIETITLATEALSFAMSVNVEKRGIFNTLMLMSMSLEEREKYLKGELTVATWGETHATLDLIKAKVMEFGANVKSTFSKLSSAFASWRNGEATLSETIAIQINTLSENHNTIAKIRNMLSKSKGVIAIFVYIGATIISTIIEITNTESTFANAYSHSINTMAIMEETLATLGLAGAVSILDIVLAPITVTILLIVGAILVLIVAIEKLGEALGWWSDFGSMFQAIGDGINRMWNAFMNSEPIQGIIQYFGDFIDTIKTLFDVVQKTFGMIFGWEDDGGTFDIVQTLIGFFGSLGEQIKWVWQLFDDFSNSPLGIITWINPLTILIFHLDEIGSFLEDVRDAIRKFRHTREFNEFVDALNEAFGELQDAFGILWDSIMEIANAFGEMFGAEEPEAQGTGERINSLVDIFRVFANILKTVVVPVIKSLAFVIRVLTIPLKIILGVIQGIGVVVKTVTGIIGLFTEAWNLLTSPLQFVGKLLDSIGNMVKSVSDAIKNSVIGKLLGWDKDNEENDDSNKDKRVISVKDGMYSKMINNVKLSNLNGSTKNQVLSELDKQKLTGNDVNNVRNLGSTYNNTNNQRQVIINQNFGEGSVPIDARNMTKKEARKMLINAFGYNRTVGKRGILR